MFKCGDYSFFVTHQTILDRLNAPDGIFDKECREIPEFLRAGAMLYNGDRILASGSDMIALLDFLLFAEIPIDVFGINPKLILEVLESDDEWECGRANIANYLCSIAPGDFRIKEWLDKGNIDYGLVEAIKCETAIQLIDYASNQSKYRNLHDLHIARIEMTALLSLPLPHLVKFTCSRVILDRPDIEYNFGIIPSMRNLEVLNIGIYSSEPTHTYKSGYATMRRGHVFRNVVFQNMPSLRSLKLRFGFINIIENASIIGNFPNLRALNCDQCNFINFSAPMLEKLTADYPMQHGWTHIFRECQNITELEMYPSPTYMEWADIDDTLVQAFPKLTKLSIELDAMRLTSKLLSMKSNKLTSFRLIMANEEGCLFEENCRDRQFPFEMCGCRLYANPNVPQHPIAGTIHPISINMPELREFCYVDAVGIDVINSHASNFGNNLQTCFLSSTHMEPYKIYPSMAPFMLAKHLIIQTRSPTSNVIDPIMLDESKLEKITYICDSGHKIPLIQVYGLEWWDIIDGYPRVAELVKRSTPLSSSASSGSFGGSLPKCAIGYCEKEITHLINDFRTIMVHVRKYIETKFKLANAGIKELAAALHSLNEYELENDDSEVYDELTDYANAISSCAEKYIEKFMPFSQHANLSYDEYISMVQTWGDIRDKLVAVLRVTRLDEIQQLKSELKVLTCSLALLK